MVFCFALQAFNWCIDPYFIRPEHTSTYWIVYNFGLASGFLFLLPFDKRLVQQMNFISINKSTHSTQHRFIDAIDWP